MVYKFISRSPDTASSVFRFSRHFSTPAFLNAINSIRTLFARLNLCGEMPLQYTSHSQYYQSAGWILGAAPGKPPAADAAKFTSNGANVLKTALTSLS
jgi:hypothetical protein